MTNPNYSAIKETILWWEKKRILYNILIIGLSIFLMYSFWDYPMREMIGSKQIIINAIVFIFGANLFYTLGWGSGVINQYFFKARKASNRRRWFFYIVGTVFSLIWTNFNFVIEFDVLFAY